MSPAPGMAPRHCFANLQRHVEDRQGHILNAEPGPGLDQTGGQFVRNRAGTAAPGRLKIEFLRDPIDKAPESSPNSISTDSVCPASYRQEHACPFPLSFASAAGARAGRRAASGLERRSFSPGRRKVHFQTLGDFRHLHDLRELPDPSAYTILVEVREHPH